MFKMSFGEIDHLLQLSWSKFFLSTVFSLLKTVMMKQAGQQRVDQPVEKKLRVQRIEMLGLQSRAADLFHVRAGLQQRIDKANRALRWCGLTACIIESKCGPGIWNATVSEGV